MASGEFFVPNYRVFLLVYAGIKGSIPSFLRAAAQHIEIVPM